MNADVPDITIEECKADGEISPEAINHTLRLPAR